MKTDIVNTGLSRTTFAESSASGAVGSSAGPAGSAALDHPPGMAMAGGDAGASDPADTRPGPTEAGAWHRGSTRRVWGWLRGWTAFFAEEPDRRPMPPENAAGGRRPLTYTKLAGFR